MTKTPKVAGIRALVHDVMSVGVHQVPAPLTPRPAPRRAVSPAPRRCPHNLPEAGIGALVDDSVSLVHDFISSIVNRKHRSDPTPRPPQVPPAMPEAERHYSRAWS